jgi:dienelactone hydrolase
MTGKWLVAVVTCMLMAASSPPLGAVTLQDYSRENVTLRTQTVPDEDRWNRATRQWELGPLMPLVPAFDGKGLLMASWTPSADPSAPTFVLAHGGGGIGGMLLHMASALRLRLNANVLILDSLWSRGRTHNGGESIARSGRTLSANVRMFDLAAAGRWLATQGVDPRKTYAIGESQGGWGVLRAFTRDPQITDLIGPHYAGGIALYPPCAERDPGVDPGVFVYHPLGPYHSRVLLITGGLDTLTPIAHCSKNTLESVEKWLHWEDATHAFNIATHGLFRESVDGTCQTMTNRFGTHQFCFNARRTQDMLREIEQFAR